MLGALVCLVSGGSKGLGYDGRDRRAVIFTHFKDSGLLNVSAFSLHELLFLLELEADKIHAGPKRQTCAGGYPYFCNPPVFLIATDQGYKPFLKNFGLNHRNILILGPGINFRQI